MKAFTLIELLIVITIVGILLTLAGSFLVSTPTDNRDSVSGYVQKKEFRAGSENNYYYIWVKDKKVQVTPVEFDRLQKGDRWPE